MNESWLALPLIIYAIVALGGVFVFLMIVRSMWQVASPNEALIVSGMGGGKGGRSFKIVTGAGTFVLPGFQTARRLSLVLHEAQLGIDCVTKQGIPVSLQGVCMYKIAADNESITNAAQRFLGQEQTMEKNIQTLADGHFRSITGNLTVEQLITDRVALTDATRDAMKGEMGALGLQIESLQIKEITDPTNYIENLALPHIADVKKAARIAQAAADQAASIAEQEAAAAKAQAASISAVKQAEYAAATAKAKATADQSGPLADAQAQQSVVVEETKLVELRAAQKERQLDVDVRKVADATAYQTQTVAQGEAQATIARATAEAQRVKLAAAADAEARTVTGAAEGSAIAARGNAEAAVVQAKALAEAAGIEARAKALATNQEAVISQTIATSLPDIVRAAAEPFSHIGDLFVLNGGEGMQGMLNGIIGSALKILPGVREAMRNGHSAAPVATSTKRDG